MVLSSFFSSYTSAINICMTFVLRLKVIVLSLQAIQLNSNGIVIKDGSIFHENMAD